MTHLDFAGRNRQIDKSQELYTMLERMYPLCRSITGDGLRETLEIIKEQIPIEINEVATGTKVFDWEIPEEWNIKDAYIETVNGEKIIDFKILNLHVLNYSIPVDKIISLEELKDHVFTLPEHPDWVPYRTSYHSRQWGFCMSHHQFMSLTDQSYHVKIDSTLTKGSLTYGECFIPGDTKKEILFSCHTCHPSLCNDNLSGISLATALAKELSGQKHRYSFRFLFIPGTIGSISWLALNEMATKNIEAGLVLTLLGDKSPFHYKKSRRGDAEIDQIMEYLLHENNEANQILDFSPYGYDERQFCSPGFNLPVGRLSRKPHGEFPEYHTSADNLDFVKPDMLNESLQLLRDAIEIIEANKVFINHNPKCEPQLGKRGLYKAIGGQSDQKDYQMALLWVLNLTDGYHRLLDIAKRSGIDFQMIKKASSQLFKAGLLSESNQEIAHG